MMARAPESRVRVPENASELVGATLSFGAEAKLNFSFLTRPRPEVASWLCAFQSGLSLGRCVFLPKPDFLSETAV